MGPAESLFQLQFFQSIRDSLNPDGGILCTQGECQWLHLDLIQNLVKSCRNIFPVVKYGDLRYSLFSHSSAPAYTTIPTYPCGQIGFLVCSTFPTEDSTGHADPSGQSLPYSPCLIPLSPYPGGVSRNEAYSPILLLCTSLRSLHSTSLHSQSTLRRLLSDPRRLRLLG